MTSQNHFLHNCSAQPTAKSNSTGHWPRIHTTESMLHIVILLSMVILSFAGCGPCQYDLVTGPYGVSDDAITASTTHRDCPIVKARFSSSRSWCPLYSGVGHFLQVEFRSVSMLKAIQTKGREDYSQWVSLYSVNISMDGITWTSLSNSTGDVQVFPGNSDRNTVVTNELEGTVIAKYIRVISVSMHSHGSMRLEVQGCPYSEISSTCHRWGAKLGSTGDVLSILLDTDASNQGLCGLKCYRQPECDSFLLDVKSDQCRLLKGSVNGSQITVDLDGVWYFVKI
ncbi:contactin-associated protein-like 2 isoform X1 [Mizuhopecten yessoensis]|uniref:contactin-associated protein-like 2 isoform X1 n=1 Tax=Mizuhopecten yessoensis TaxID=6573 RepID=UPI000B45CDF1|nr:contactin-associated protein-like 2 isoform X1 [Mizuhopecten yessoensis]